MKPILFSMILLVSFFTFAQQRGDPYGESEGGYASPAAQLNKKYGLNKRVSVIVGGGASIVATELYEIPVVNKADNSVIIGKAKNIKPNLSLGIAYTPFIKSMVRDISVLRNGGIAKETIVEYVPHGVTFSLFLNPLSLTGVSANSIANTVDIGFGIGWRSGDFSFLITNEYFSVKQPRPYFIAQHGNNDTPYIINGQIQSSIDPTDNNIFKNEVAMSWGLKIAYTFDITKSFIF